MIGFHQSSKQWATKLREIEVQIQETDKGKEPSVGHCAQSLRADRRQRPSREERRRYNRNTNVIVAKEPETQLLVYSE
jgi:hypothetical protein